MQTSTMTIIKLLGANEYGYVSVCVCDMGNAMSYIVRLCVRMLYGHNYCAGRWVLIVVWLLFAAVTAAVVAVADPALSYGDEYVTVCRPYPSK